MRDPNRVYAIWTRVAQTWQKNVHDWRLTQLCVNFMSHMRSDCFYMEDEDFITRLEEFLDEIGQ